MRHGSLVFFPKGIADAFRVRSETTRFVNLYSQAGFEQIIEFTGRPTDERIISPPYFKGPEVDATRRPELFAELGMHVVDLADPFASS